MLDIVGGWEDDGTMTNYPGDETMTDDDFDTEQGMARRNAERSELIALVTAGLIPDEDGF